MGKSEKIIDPGIYSFTKITTRKKINGQSSKSVRPKKGKFLPWEGSDNFELEFEVKARKNAYINLCRRNRGVETPRCFQFALGVMESDNQVSYIKYQNTEGTTRRVVRWSRADTFFSLFS